MRKIVLSIVGLVLIAVAVYVASLIIDSNNSTRPKPDKVVKTVFANKVSNGSVSIVVPANGTVIAKRRVELFSEVQGVFRKGTKLFKAL